ncbi:uncharacterized protein I206_101495 [Kwoniella pini CBS 10737]|uniref:Uncharacterized protein n=1 Tax=Kwoniella pini CBS 10737 TaxID=1296096 RepID=A0A1B9HWJ5_9TREE|nr:uncharacterized protein I206_06532 [Kwoniella pini CBS 10737]OCF47629.1 hypothetical protein I206_06532 [Kwoniella pini CBS 10737]
MPDEEQWNPPPAKNDDKHINGTVWSEKKTKESRSSNKPNSVTTGDNTNQSKQTSSAASGQPSGRHHMGGREFVNVNLWTRDTSSTNPS